MGRSKHRSRAERAICPLCGRNTAAMWNVDMTMQRGESTFLLHPHNKAPGERCRGWMIGKEHMVPATPVPAPAETRPTITDTSPRGTHSWPCPLYYSGNWCEDGTAVKKCACDDKGAS